MGKRLRSRIDPTLFELCFGILLYGVAFQAAILVFSGKPAYSAGLWIGVFLAVAGAFHMWWSLDRGLDLPEKDAVKSMGTQNIIRYIVLVVVMGALMCTDFANPIFAFCGYMGMKLSAYLNPLIHRLVAGKKGQEQQEIPDGTAL